MFHPSYESLLSSYKHKPQRSSLQVKSPKMCTPWTLRNLLARRRVKDGHLNLSKSRFRLEDDTNGSNVTTIQQPRHQHEYVQSNNAQPSSSSSPREGETATTLVTRYSYSRNNEAPSVPSRISVIKRGKHKRRVTIGSNQTSSSSSSLGDVGDGADETDWPPFTDEDYIVFCFEQDGDFHVVKDDNPKSRDNRKLLNQTLQGDDNVNLRDRFLSNRAVEEERFYFSPRLQSDGIKSLTRFKEEDDDEDMKIVEARSRVDEEMDYDDMDGIKRREQNNENENEENMMCEDDLECHKTSMECRDGSVESAGSSQPDWVRQLQVTKTDQEIGLASSSQVHEDPSSSKNGKLERPMYIREILLSNKMGDDEESIYLSSESQQGGSQGDEESAGESAETSDTSQLEEDDETALESDKSKCSTSSSSSFEFPVLQLEWCGSPVKWPRSKSISMRKHKPRRVRLRCCRF